MSASISQQKRQWFHPSVIYHLYPSSFYSHNSTPTGTIRGIISKIPYLASLKIDCIWLSACYLSGGIDNGYDVIDYREIDPQYGTVADVEELVRELGKVGIRLIMDLVVNHTSDRHAWFREGKEGKASMKRGSAWTYDENTDEWYLRVFASQQPDLDWENEQVRQTVYADMRFWMDKGVAGFRMDVINMIAKPQGLPDAEIVDQERFLQPPYKLICDGEKVHEYLAEMRREGLNLYPETLAVGETICVEMVEDVRRYVDSGRKELDMVYQYDIFGIDHGKEGKFSAPNPPWTLQHLKGLIEKWQSGFAWSKGSWGAVWLESHDSGRAVSRFGDGTERNRFKVAKLLALLGITLGGTLFVYQGQELGMKNLSLEIPVDEYPDIETQADLDCDV